MANKITLIELGNRKTSSNCEHCGREIMNRYTVQFSDGENEYAMIVGADCAKALLGEKFNTSPMEQRRKKAESEWKKQTPKPRKDETKEEYVNRRIVEKGNAYSAWLKWQKLNAGKLARIATEALGFTVGDDDYQTTNKAEYWNIVRKFEAETGANHYDIWNADSRSIARI